MSDRRSPNLRIEASQSGGHLPVAREWSIDSAGGDPDELTAAIRALEASRFFEIADPAADVMPDRELLSLLVEIDGQSRRLTFSADRVPDAIEPLVSFVLPRLKWSPRRR